jgi:hypothetical protein
VDTQELGVLRRAVKSVRDEVDKLTQSFNNAANASGRIQPGGGGGKAQNGMPIAPPNMAAQRTGGLHTGGFGGGSFQGLRGIANQGPGTTLIGASIASSAAGMVGGAISDRVDRAANYASSADKLNVLFQQMTGMSQMAIMNQRKPLQNYRIGGQEGANAMMQFASTTGYMATPQMAKSIEGIRTATGYSKSTADILQDQQALLNPNVANRMYRELGGVNAYSTGGQMRDPLEMRQQLVRSLGLTNDNILKGAMSPGSVTRYRMTNAGVPVEMQDEVLQYAQQQQAYTRKGGKGTYDPSNEQHRKFMGIEENYATQQEETDRVKGNREEDFMRRQIDNLADLEKSNQQLIKALGSLEDKMSGLIGGATSARNYAAVGGRVMQAAGLAAMLIPGVGTGVGAGLLVGGSAIAAASGSGDPVDATGGGGAASTPSSSAANDANIHIPYGYGGKRKSLTEVKADADFRRVDPRLQNRLLAMFRENPNVGIGDSHRDPSEQERMFRSRYRKTDKNTGIFWDGSYWEHVSGAAAAPPGRSFHEVGLASDLVGDLGWMNANAHRFGLKHFANVNNEPWHVQLAELPNSRREWEGAGGKVEPAGAMVEGGTVVAPQQGDDHPSGGGGGFGGGLSLAGGFTSIADIIASMSASVGGGSSARSPGRRSKGTSGSASGSAPGTTPGAGSLSGAEVAALAFQAGFRGQDLINMVAIAKRESRWVPTAYNGNLGTGDQSYGLWQINTLNSAKGGQMGKLVNQILGRDENSKDFSALFDPATNARVAFEFYKRNGNTLRPWGAYKGMENTYGTDVAEAAQIVSQAGYQGDPMPEGGGGRGGNASIISNTKNNITFAPNVVIQGTSSTPDLHRVAQEAIAIMKQELEVMEMRSA